MFQIRAATMSCTPPDGRLWILVWNTAMRMAVLGDQATAAVRETTDKSGQA
ncbi:hypothetical protein ACFOWZ_14970 [Lentzea rhizosphaerae]|uniref:Uncharacterized protein n=1 Tax=Lentzea rhizosphaerae TaxID=2041025 RepID=A0ABV8BSU3_9PSEU